MKKIFSSNEDYMKTAHLNWRISNHEDIENMLVLAEGFMTSALELSNNCLKNNSDKKADILIFPILHNANHGIELYLKALIWTLNELLNSHRGREGGHNIQQLFQTAQAKIKLFKDNDWLRDFNEKNNHLADYIDELFSMISGYGTGDNMDFSRYPITDKYDNHFYVDRLDNVEVDLENFIERFECIKEALCERVSYFFYQEYKGEW